tara:strand:+ start:672 stop:980 length:309 start_codon:yes stop_codon:yes gene_type:complete
MLRFDVLYDDYEDEKCARIRLTDSKWDGIIYHYETVSFREEDEEAVLKFDYEIDSAPEDFDVDNLTPNDQADFESYIGDILVSLIEEKTDESGANSIKQSNI